MSMNCECGLRAKCTDSRMIKPGVRRRYTCACGSKFSTLETLFEYAPGCPPKFWTGDKEKILRDNYQTMKVSELAELFGVSKGAIYEQAFVMKIKRHPKE